MRAQKLGGGYTACWGIGSRAGELMVSDTDNSILFNGAVGGDLTDIDQVISVNTYIYVMGPVAVSGQPALNYGIVRIETTNWTVDKNCAVQILDKNCCQLLGTSYFAVWKMNGLFITDMELVPKFNGVVSGISKIDTVYLDDDGDIKLFGTTVNVANATYGVSNITVSDWTQQLVVGC